MGMQVFWFEHCETQDKDFNEEYIRIYLSESSQSPIMRIHVSNLIPVPTAISLQRVGGCYYPELEWCRSIRKEWDT